MISKNVETRVTLYQLEWRLIGVHAYGLGQITIAVGIIGNQLAEQRDNLERIKIVERLQTGHSRLGELQYQRAPARFQDPVDRRQGAFFMRDVAQTEGHSHAIKVIIGKWQPLGVGLQILDMSHHPLVDQPLTSLPQHGGIDVGEDDLAPLPYPLRKLFGKIAGAASEIQHPLTRLDAAHLDGKAFPQTVNAERHDIVHQVVLTRHRAEHAGDPRRLFGDRHLLKPEVCGSSLRHCPWLPAPLLYPACRNRSR